MKRHIIFLLVVLSLGNIVVAQIPTIAEKEKLARQICEVETQVLKQVCKDTTASERFYWAQKQWRKKIAEEVHNNKKNADLTIYKINQDQLEYWRKYLQEPRKQMEIPKLANPFNEFEDKKIPKVTSKNNDEPQDFKFYQDSGNIKLLESDQIDRIYQDEEWLVNISTTLLEGEENYKSNLNFYSSKSLRLVTSVSILGSVVSIHKNIDNIFTLSLGGGGLSNHLCAIDPIKNEFSWLHVIDNSGLSSEQKYVTLAKKNGQPFKKISNKYFSNYLYEINVPDDKNVLNGIGNNKLGGLPFARLSDKSIIAETTSQIESFDEQNFKNKVQFINNNTSLALVSDNDKQSVHLMKSHHDRTICDISLTEITSAFIKTNDRKPLISGLFSDGTLFYVCENSLYLVKNKTTKQIDKYKNYVLCGNSILAFSSVLSSCVSGLDAELADSKNLQNTRGRENFVGTTPLSGLCKIDSNGGEHQCETPAVLLESNPVLFSIHGDFSLVSKYNWHDYSSLYSVYDLYSDLPVGFPIIGGSTLASLGPGYINFGKSPKKWLLYSYCDYADSGLSYRIQAQNINERKIITLLHTPESASPLEMRLKADGSFQLIFSCLGITKLLEYSQDGIFQRILAEWKSPPEEGDPLLLSERNLIFIPKAGGYDAYRIFGEGNPEKAFEISLRGSSDYVILLANGFYAGSPGCERLITLQAGDGRVDATALAPWRNRPAEVIKALGGDPKTADILSKVTERWLKRSKFDPTQPEPKASEIAKVSVTQMPPLWAPSQQVSFPIEATAGGEPLKEVNVRVNGVLQKSFSGGELNVPKGGHATLNASVNLAEGQNWIEVTVTDAKGRPSNLEHFRTILPKASETPKRYIVAMGCSEYDRPELNLQYAAKDAGDVLKTFSAAGGRECKTLLLTNKEVEPGALDKIKAFVADSKESDEVILFCAGHGLLDEHLDYVYAGHQIDTEHPGDTGIHLDALLDAVGSGKSLKRLVLMDTCQSGSVGEKEEMKLAQASTELPHGVRAVKSRALKVVGVSPLTGDEQQRFIEEMFLLPGQYRGINIIGASGGAEYAMESDKWNNGVFTSALIEALRDQKADMDHRGRISVSDLKTYLAQRVSELTGGAQKPSVVAFEQDQDFDLVGKMPPIPEGVLNAAAKSENENLGNVNSGAGSSSPPPHTLQNGGSPAILDFPDALAKADAGDGYAQGVVSIYYTMGYKVPKDTAKGLTYALKSAAQKNPLGTYQVGALRELGVGIKKDKVQGHKLMSEAFDGLNTLSGDPYALYDLGYMALSGIGVEQNPREAARLFKASADMGYAPAQRMFAKFLEAGVGVPKDLEAARQYQSQSSAQWSQQ
jgi:hypothetical protein